MHLVPDFPEIGRSYLGPLGLTYRVLDIEGPPGVLQWVIIRSDAPGCGTIRLPSFDAAKWLSPLPTA